MFKKKKIELPTFNDNEIISIFDGENVDLKELKDNLFKKQLLGKTIALKPNKNKVNICSPVNGKIIVLFNDGHSFTIKANNGLEILVHYDNENEDVRGFKVLKELGSDIKAMEAIVEMDLKQLNNNIVTLTVINNWDINFKKLNEVSLGESLI